MNLKNELGILEIPPNLIPRTRAYDHHDHIEHFFLTNAAIHRAFH